MYAKMDKKIAEIKRFINMGESELEAMLQEPRLSPEKKRLIASRLENIQLTTRRKAETEKVKSNGGVDDRREE